MLFGLVNLLGATPWCWCGKRMGPSDSALISDDSTCRPRRIPTLSPGYKRCWRAWLELHTSPLWTSRVDFGRSAWPQELQQYTAFMVSNLGFYEFMRMPFGLCNVPTTFQHLMQNTARRVELDLLCHLPGQRDSIWLHRRTS